jgi:hypothetical protein
MLADGLLHSYLVGLGAEGGLLGGTCLGERAARRRRVVGGSGIGTARACVHRTVNKKIKST